MLCNTRLTRPNKIKSNQIHLHIIPVTLNKDTMHYFDKSSLWLKSECIVVPLKKLDAQEFYYILPILGTQFLNPD